MPSFLALSLCAVACTLLPRQVLADGSKVQAAATAEPKGNDGGLVLTVERQKRLKPKAEHNHKLYKRQFDAVAKPGYADYEYVAPFTIGGQVLNLNIDTGSADFWVFGHSLPPNQYTAQITDLNTNFTTISEHTLYDPTLSKSVKLWESYYFNMGYPMLFKQDTQANGTVVDESIEFSTATVTSFPIGVATQVTQPITEDMHSDGVVGLAFSPQNSIYLHEQPVGVPQRTPQMTFLEAILPQLKAPVFTAALSYGSDGKYGFGAVDHSLTNGTIYNFTVHQDNSLWQFDTSRTVYFGNQSFHMTNSTSTAIADTGQTLLLMSWDVVEAYYKRIPSAVFQWDRPGARYNGWIYKCNEVTDKFYLPVGTGLGQYNLTITSMVYDKFDFAGDMCYGKLQYLQGYNTHDPSFHIIGDAMLKEHFVVFNLSSKTAPYTNINIGFADRPGPPP